MEPKVTQQIRTRLGLKPKLPTWVLHRCHTLTLTSWDSCTPCCCPTSITLSLVTSSGLPEQRLHLSPDQWGHRRHQNRIPHAFSPHVLLSVTSNSLGTNETSEAPEQSFQIKQRTTSDSHINTDEFLAQMESLHYLSYVYGEHNLIVAMQMY